MFLTIILIISYLQFIMNYKRTGRFNIINVKLYVFSLCFKNITFTHIILYGVAYNI